MGPNLQGGRRGRQRDGVGARAAVERAIRAGVAGLCSAAGLIERAQRRARGSLTILCYHRVLPPELKAGYFAPDLVVTPAALRAHCRALARWYEVAPLGVAVERWRRGQEGERPLAAITFDDGYQDNHAHAAPVLEACGLRATFFVISGLVGSQARPWFDALAQAVELLHGRGELGLEPGGPRLLDRAWAAWRWDQAARAAVERAKALSPRPRAEAVARLVELAGEADGRGEGRDRVMTWSQLEALASAGHEIGSHGRTHEILTQLDDELLAAELAGSRAELEAGLGRPVRSLGYPNGDADLRVARQASAAGYACAVTTEPGANAPGRDPLRLRRRFIHEERLRGLVGPLSRRLLHAELTGVADLVFHRLGRLS